MIDFKPLTIESREIIESFFKNSTTRLAELNFTNLFMWNNAFNASWAIINSSLVIRMDLKDANGPTFTMPIGPGKLAPIFEELEKITDLYNSPLSIRSVSDEQVPELMTLFPNTFDLSLKESYSDYIYTAESLATLTGKKLHSKRNHINRFESTAPWHTKLITADDLDRCREFAETWFKKNTEKNDISYDQEEAALSRLFDNYDNLSVDGMMLYQNDTLVAFTFGEVLSQDTFLVHYEKADSDTNGAYPMINREFARFVTETYPQITYINREEDMGIDGLRRAKQSYYPALMGKKFVLTKKK